MQASRRLIAMYGTWVAAHQDLERMGYVNRGQDGRLGHIYEGICGDHVRLIKNEWRQDTPYEVYAIESLETETAQAAQPVYLQVKHLKLVVNN